MYKLLLIFIPVSIIFQVMGLDDIYLFITAALAIVPLAGIMAGITKEVAGVLGPRCGGLLNVTFGNATEFIISFFALRAGLPAVVKAAITGSILSNILFVLGLSFFCGGLVNGPQRFDKHLATVNGLMLMLAIISLFVPAIFYAGSPRIKEEVLGYLSLGVAAILLGVYGAGLWFTFRRGLVRHPTPSSNRPLRKTVPTLLGITVLIAVESEVLVSAIEGVETTLGLSRIFIGIVLVPLIANVAENTTAVIMARQNNLELSLAIAIGSSVQVALFLVPLLIFASHLVGQPMNLLFNLLEISALIAAVMVANLVYLQGRSTWLEGLQLVAVYLILALAFFLV